MTTNIPCVLGTTDYLILIVHNTHKNNGETEWEIVCREEISTYKSIQKKNTNISYAPSATTIKPCMTSNIPCVIGTTDYLILIVHNKNKNNGETERTFFCREETSTYKSIQKKNTKISYAPSATTIKPCMTTNIPCVLGTTDYLTIIVRTKHKKNDEIERGFFCREETSTYKSIQKKNTKISYAPSATTIKPCMTTNIPCVLGTTDYLTIIVHTKHKKTVR